MIFFNAKFRNSTPDIILNYEFKSLIVKGFLIKNPQKNNAKIKTKKTVKKNCLIKINEVKQSRYDPWKNENNQQQ